MFVNKAINTVERLQTWPSSRVAAKNIPREVQEGALPPVFTHKINKFILSTKNLAIVKRGLKLFKSIDII